LWPRLMPVRLLGMTVLNGLGIALARMFLGAHPLACLITAALWCAVWIFALGLVGKNDWSALAVMPLKEIEEDLPHEDLVS
jgi:hypothetical protein